MPSSRELSLVAATRDVLHAYDHARRHPSDEDRRHYDMPGYQPSWTIALAEGLARYIAGAHVVSSEGGPVPGGPFAEGTRLVVGRDVIAHLRCRSQLDEAANPLARDFIVWRLAPAVDAEDWFTPFDDDIVRDGTWDTRRRVKADVAGFMAADPELSDEWRDGVLADEAGIRRFLEATWRGALLPMPDADDLPTGYEAAKRLVEEHERDTDKEQL